MTYFVSLLICFVGLQGVVFSQSEVHKMPCNATYRPEDCDLPELPLSSLTSVDDFERCAPALLPKVIRNYFWSGSGREMTLFENKEAFKRIHIVNQVLRDVSKNHLFTTVLGQWISFPIGVSPTGGHNLAHPDGEMASSRAVASMDTVLIVSSYATTTLEEIATNFRRHSGHLWMQIYFFRNKLQTIDIVLRAERSGYKAIVVTVDSPISPEGHCNSRGAIIKKLNFLNFFGHKQAIESPAATFNDLAWLCSITKLPVVAKGILTGADAVKAARAGVAAILVSNHGGRQLDSASATIDVLPDIVAALKLHHPQIEVYMDGGVRTGNDVFKAMLRGARAVFVGRPIVWGLTAGGEEGVKKVLTILKSEFNETMIVAGFSSPKDIAERETSTMLTTDSTKPITIFK